MLLRLSIALLHRLTDDFDRDAMHLTRTSALSTEDLQSQCFLVSKLSIGISALLFIFLSRLRCTRVTKLTRHSPRKKSRQIFAKIYAKGCETWWGCLNGEPSTSDIAREGSRRGKKHSPSDDTCSSTTLTISTSVAVYVLFYDIVFVIEVIIFLSSFALCVTCNIITIIFLYPITMETMGNKEDYSNPRTNTSAGTRVASMMKWFRDFFCVIIIHCSLCMLLNSLTRLLTSHEGNDNP